MKYTDDSDNEIVRSYIAGKRNLTEAERIRKPAKRAVPGKIRAVKEKIRAVPEKIRTGKRGATLAAAAFCLLFLAAAPITARADGGYQWQRLNDHWYYRNDDGAVKTGWEEIDGKYYHFGKDGAMTQSAMTVGETVYSFTQEGSAAYAKQVKNSGGGAFDIGFYSQKCQELADNLNELKKDNFDGDQKPGYYEDDKVDYDKNASFVISGRLTEIAEHRLSLARTRGYGDGTIPEEGTLSDYLKAINYNPGRRSMEVYLRNCDGADQAEERLLRKHGADQKKRRDRAVAYTEMGIAHQEADGRDYYMVLFMR